MTEQDYILPENWDSGVTINIYGAKRYCLNCRAILRQGNPGTFCGPCDAAADARDAKRPIHLTPVERKLEKMRLSL